MTATRSTRLGRRWARNSAHAQRTGPRFEKSLEAEIDLDAFAAKGRAIARAVKAELPGWSIVYFDEAETTRAKYHGAPASYDPGIS